MVTEGTLGPGQVFLADTVLAKHDENYMPREVVDDLKARGLWEDGKGMPGPSAMPVSASGTAGAGT